MCSWWMLLVQVSTHLQTLYPGMSEGPLPSSDAQAGPGNAQHVCPCSMQCKLRYAWSAVTTCCMQVLVNVVCKAV